MNPGRWWPRLRRLPDLPRSVADGGGGDGVGDLDGITARLPHVATLASAEPVAGALPAGAAAWGLVE